MRIVFWQNCLSPHQLPYICELMNDNRVDVVDIVVGETLSNNRKTMGWELPQELDGKFHIEGGNVYIQPNEDEIESLLKNRVNDSVHFFSGIRGFPFVYRAFRTSLKYNLKRGIITERPNTYAFGLANGKPLWLHKMRFFFQDKKYVPYIHFIFAVGEECADYYSSISNNWKIFPFAYCTAPQTIDINVENCNYNIKTQANINILYVGTLAWWKGIDSLLSALKGHNYISVDLIGDGQQRRELEQMVSKLQLQNVHFMGYKKNSDLLPIMTSHDILILPSVYDGWGAVVNEALMNGLFVICSNKCGAKDLIRDKRLGMVFKGGNSKELSDYLSCAEQHITEIRQNRMFRQKWAEEHIGGKAISRYMVNCLNAEGIMPPWRQ